MSCRANPAWRRLLDPASVLTRYLNPRYAWLPDEALEQPVRILDAGCGPKDGLMARRLFRRGCWYEGVSLWQPDPATRETRAFDRYHQQDLDATELEFLPQRSFDYVVCSHTLEHLQDGRAVLRRLCDKVRPGGRLYLEWPSLESQTFPVCGYGLNFFDDPTHRQTYGLDVISKIIVESGLEIIFAGRRRNWLRMLLAPFLTAYHSLKARRLLLYDLWDFTGFAYVVTAKRKAGDAAVDTEAA
ncbi:MAG TPA: class I SAM-dependent methyltransferase [Dehalococcoidia bacterium]|nr:class I SAM-dependent methyltransferase [Dehalococcoidia bacterium]